MDCKYQTIKYPVLCFVSSCWEVLMCASSNASKYSSTPVSKFNTHKSTNIWIESTIWEGGKIDRAILASICTCRLYIFHVCAIWSTILISPRKKKNII